VPAIEEAYTNFTAALADEASAPAGDVNHNLVVLQALIEGLPDGARAAIQDVIDRADERNAAESPTGTDAGETKSAPTGAGPGPAADDGPQPDPPGQVDATPRPERTPRPEPTPEPQGSPNGQPGGSAPDRGPNGYPEDGAAD
jgi:hypothetical protein